MRHSLAVAMACLALVGCSATSTASTTPYRAHLAVKVRASLSYGGLEEVPQEGTVEVSFRIKGAEDPYESTFEVTEGGSYSPDEVMVSTRSSKAKLTAEVTDVEYSP